MLATMYGILLKMEKAINEKGMEAYPLVMQLNAAFSKLETRAFGSGVLTAEEQSFDLARNNLLMRLTQGITEQEREGFRRKAKACMQAVQREVNK